MSEIRRYKTRTSFFMGRIVKLWVCCRILWTQQTGSVETVLLRTTLVTVEGPAWPTCYSSRLWFSHKSCIISASSIQLLLDTTTNSLYLCDESCLRTDIGSTHNYVCSRCLSFLYSKGHPTYAVKRVQRIAQLV